MKINTLMYSCDWEVLFLAISQVYPEMVIEAKKYLVGKYGHYISNETIIGYCAVQIDSSLDSKLVVDVYNRLLKLKSFT